jgi:hydroxyacylglutathione hydrolase
MEVKQLYTNCLSEAAYFIVSNGAAAVIDPLRDVDSYLALAKEHNATIKYIFETHFHADFVSGHLDLAAKTGAPIVYGPDTEAQFPITLAKDGQIFTIGDITLEVLHTPGHTLESTCYLLRDEQAVPYCVFTGDTLFVGDVGRPDLFSGDLTKEELAAMMYDSLNNKIKPLEDHIIVYPAHGPGSSCGKNLGPDTFSTIGSQKSTNYALQPMSREEFIKAVTTGLNAPPVYFPKNASLNKKGYNSLDSVLSRGLTALSVPEFKDLVAKDAWIVDTRPATVFTHGFVPGAISLGLDGRIAEWAGNVIPLEQPLVLVTLPGKEQESITRLARVGVDNILGYLSGGFEAWETAGETVDLIIDIEPDELAMDIPFDENLEVIDVRKPSEFEAGHVAGAKNLPVETLVDPLQVAMLNDTNNLYIHCAGGYRSVIAASLLKRQGLHNLRNVLGGYGKIKVQEGIPLEVPAALNS